MGVRLYGVPNNQQLVCTRYAGNLPQAILNALEQTDAWDDFAPSPNDVRVVRIYVTEAMTYISLGFETTDEYGNPVVRFYRPSGVTEFKQILTGGYTVSEGKIVPYLRNENTGEVITNPFINFADDDVLLPGCIGITTAVIAILVILGIIVVAQTIQTWLWEKGIAEKARIIERFAEWIDKCVESRGANDEVCAKLVELEHKINDWLNNEEPPPSLWEGLTRGGKNTLTTIIKYVVPVGIITALLVLAVKFHFFQYIIEMIRSLFRRERRR